MIPCRCHETPSAPSSPPERPRPGLSVRCQCSARRTPSPGLACSGTWSRNLVTPSATTRANARSRTSRPVGRSRRTNTSTASPSAVHLQQPQVGVDEGSHGAGAQCLGDPAPAQARDPATECRAAGDRPGRRPHKVGAECDDQPKHGQGPKRVTQETHQDVVGLGRGGGARCLLLAAVPTCLIPCGPAPGRVVPFWCPARPLILRARARGHRVDLAQPDRASLRGSPRRYRRLCLQALPPERRVVALGEVVGVSRSGHPGAVLSLAGCGGT